MTGQFVYVIVCQLKKTNTHDIINTCNTICMLYTNYIKDAYLIKRILPLNSVSIGTKEIYASYAFNNIESH